MRPVLGAAVLVAALAAWTAPALSAPASNPLPALAYYYIWFDSHSWTHAKRDYPLAGRYSSDDVDVMRTHVAEAQAAGLDGFIVSWKSTPTLDRRLAKLIQVADARNFKLAINYEGLDVRRQPLPPSRVAADLDYFRSHFASDPAFQLFDKPLVIWAGTWKFSAADIARVAVPLRKDLLILASERDVGEFSRVADVVDGDAYYWSSVDPWRSPGYGGKLAAFSDAVHAHAGLWIAPAAPGFDARMIGGTRVVDRRDGATLRRELDTAVASSPDAVGVISWNEFTENSHVEPSRRYGRRSLQVLSDFRGAKVGSGAAFDSSEPTTGIGYALPFLSGLAGVLVTGLLVVASRASRRRGAGGDGQERRFSGGSTAA